MRIVVAAICLLAAPSVAAAQENRPGALAPIYACADQTDPTARLACYDAAVANVRAAEQRGDVVAVDRAQAEEIQRDSFGLTIPSVSRLLGLGGDDGDLDELALQIASVRVRGDGKSVITMTNGQIWTQVEGGRLTRPLRAGDSVTISRSGLGGFLMSMPRGGAALRVRRENS